MKNIILFLSLFLGFAAFGVVEAHAQKMPTAEELTKKNIDELEKRLVLSSTQKSIITKYAYDLSKLQLDLVKKQKSQGVKDEELTRFYKSMNETNAKIRELLKPEQVKEFNIILEERLNGGNSNKKKKKNKKNEAEEKIVGIEGLKRVNNP
ncbi:MAG: hypothetical protein EOO99_00525 [Pedobacter sp.]|nr:MAG: hypothetical protein EOO99_00525 [Pedobacter sp.]